MKDAIRSLAHIAAIAALTLIVVIAVVALLMATGCTEESRDQRPSAFILDGGEVEQTAIPGPAPLTAQALYDDFKVSDMTVPIQHKVGIDLIAVYGSRNHGKTIGWQRSQA